MKSLRILGPTIAAGTCLVVTGILARASSPTGNVQSSAAVLQSGTYYGYLFVTGAATPCDHTGPLLVQNGAQNFFFRNVPTGKRYFIRVVEKSGEGGNYGGQCPDQMFNGGTMTLHQTQLVADWYPDGTVVPY